MTDPSSATVRAAGCVVWTGTPEALRFAVVHRPRYDDWSFPKGKVDEGETELECAIREVEEETGLVGDIGAELLTLGYVDHRDRPKTVRYWLLERTGGAFVVNDEVDELRWLSTAEAADLLTYEHDRHLLEVAVGELAPPSSG